MGKEKVEQVMVQYYLIKVIIVSGIEVNKYLEARA